MRAGLVLLWGSLALPGACVANYGIDAESDGDGDGDGNGDGDGDGDGDCDTGAPPADIPLSGSIEHRAIALLPQPDQPDRIVVTKEDSVVGVCTFVMLANRNTFPGQPPPSPFPWVAVPDPWMVEDARTTDDPQDCLDLPLVPQEVGVEPVKMTGWIDMEPQALPFPCAIEFDLQLTNPTCTFTRKSIGLLAPNLEVIGGCPPP